MKRIYWIGIALMIVIIFVMFYLSTPIIKAEVGIPNPAAVYCREQGCIYKIVTEPDGSQYGMCCNLVGECCDAWAFYKGECYIECPVPTTFLLLLFVGLIILIILVYLLLKRR